MNSGPENRFIKSVHDKLPKEIYKEKMHNPYRGGTADVWYSGERDAWIEYKWIDSVPKKGVLIPALSPLQVIWCTDRFNEGRNVYVVVGCPLGAIVFSNPADWEDGVKVGKLALFPKPFYVDWLHELIGRPNAGRKSTKKRGTKRDVDI